MSWVLRPWRGKPVGCCCALGDTADSVVIGGRVIRGARTQDPKLGVAVTVYMLVLVIMLDVAWWSGVAAAMAGALFFVASDAMIGWSRFVNAFRHHHVAIMVTYHVAQALLVVSLATS